MGLVYLATHERLPGLFVVKTPRLTLSDAEQVAARLRQEAKVLASLNHPNIVRVFDFNETPNGTPYLVLEFLDGRDLHEILNARPLRPWEVVAIVRQVASALAAAHACKIIHRDLKPENVLIVPVVGQDDAVKLIDFGVSKLWRSTRNNTGSRQVIGTPNYMSPEQAHGDNGHVDARTDQFALAVMTYEMLAREAPYVDKDPLVVLNRIVKEAMPSLASKMGRAGWTPKEVEKVLARGMAKDPAARYASVHEFSQALERAVHADVGGSPEPLQLFEAPTARHAGPMRVDAAPENAARPAPPDVETAITTRWRVPRNVVPSGIQTQPVRLKRRRYGRLSLLVASAVAAGVLLLSAPAQPVIAAWRFEVRGLVQQLLLVQTRVSGLSKTAANPGILQPASSDSGSAHPLPP